MSVYTIENLAKQVLGDKPSANEPNREQLAALLEGDPTGPFHFVNLLAFHEHASYPPGHEFAGAGLGGEEAYDKYGIVALDHVTKRGGRLMNISTVEKQLVGSPSEWHRVATMEYRSTHDFIEMILDPDYRAALVHREAGLKATDIFITRPLITEPVS